MNTAEKCLRIARIVAHIIGSTGCTWNDAVEKVAHDLGCPERAVWAAVNVAREMLNDPYLESISA